MGHGDDEGIIGYFDTPLEGAVQAFARYRLPETPQVGVVPSWQRRAAPGEKPSRTLAGGRPSQSKAAEGRGCVEPGGVRAARMCAPPPGGRGKGANKACLSCMHAPHTPITGGPESRARAQTMKPCETRAQTDPHTHNSCGAPRTPNRLHRARWPTCRRGPTDASAPGADR